MRRFSKWRLVRRAELELSLQDRELPDQRITLELRGSARGVHETLVVRFGAVELLAQDDGFLDGRIPFGEHPIALGAEAAQIEVAHRLRLAY